MSNDFYTTKKLFSEYLGYVKPLSFSEWMALPSDKKAAVLYVQFFDQVSLAWYKTQSSYSVAADGVAETLQYLQKNVSKIEADEKRFTPGYIYRVCYNCLFCLCRDPNRYKAAYENECSNIIGYGEDELDLFDTVSDDNDRYEQYEKESIRERFWTVIESLSEEYPEVHEVVAKLLGGDVRVDSKKTVYTSKQYQKDLHESWKLPKSEQKAFMDSRKPKGYSCYTEFQINKVSSDKVSEIVAELKIRLDSFRNIFN